MSNRAREGDLRAASGSKKGTLLPPDPEEGLWGDVNSTTPSPRRRSDAHFLCCRGAWPAYLLLGVTLGRKGRGLSLLPVTSALPWLPTPNSQLPSTCPRLNIQSKLSISRKVSQVNLAFLSHSSDTILTCRHLCDVLFYQHYELPEGGNEAQFIHHYRPIPPNAVSWTPVIYNSVKRKQRNSKTKGGFRMKCCNYKLYLMQVCP